MTPIRLAVNELRRVTAGRLPKIAVLALLIVPLLYGAMYLYANWDPYGNLKDVPAALVVDDKGTSLNGKTINAGDEVADELPKQAAFDWHKVSDSEAESGVRDGKYLFALTLPSDFSAALASPAQFAPRQGVLQLTTNDANNYLGSTIANKVVDAVHAAVSKKVGSTAADQLLLGFATIRDKTSQAADGAAKLADGAAKTNSGAQQLASGASDLATGQHKLLDGANQLADGVPQLKNGATQLSSGLDTLRDKTSSLPNQASALAQGATQVAQGNAQVAQVGNQIATATQQFVSDLDNAKGDIATRLHKAGLTDAQVQQVLNVLAQVRKPIDDANSKVQATSGELQKLAAGAQQVANGAGQLAAAAPQLSSGIGQAANGADQLNSGINKAGDGILQLRDGLNTATGGADKLASGSKDLANGTQQLTSGSAQIRDGLNAGVQQIPDPNDPTRTATAQTIGDPIAVQTLGQATAPTYGAGLAPFFLGLAAWIGAFVLFLLLRPLSRRALAANQHPVIVALGGWLPAAALSIAQVVLLFAVVTTIVGVHPADPFGTLGFLALTGLAFTAMLHGLNALFGAVGKFLGLVLLILQLTTAGGTFPWQTTPALLHPLHLALPLSYVVDGLRHLLYGGALDSMPLDIGVLAGYLLLGIGLAVFAAYRQRVWTVSRLKPELVL